MVGGNVKEVLNCGDRIWINVGGRPGTSEERNELGLYVEITKASKAIHPGDAIWWQGRQAFWTSQHYSGPINGGAENGIGVLWDVAIPRIGYSGASHPAKKLIESAFSR